MEPKISLGDFRFIDLDLKCLLHFLLFKLGDLDKFFGQPGKLNHDLVTLLISKHLNFTQAIFKVIDVDNPRVWKWVQQLNL